MSNTGKFLESFVNRIEKILLPDSFTISSNEKVFKDDGTQIAEFDIEIEGKVGTTNFKWLIECRDRPTQGPAPGSWIEQLVGRRDRFKFDKVIAVSTTGFAEGAKEYAKDAGIEIRTVTEANIDQINDWFLLKNMSLCKRGVVLEHATLLVDKNEPKERQEALNKILVDNSPESKILMSTETGKRITVATAFALAASDTKGLYDEIIPQGGAIKVNLHVTYPQDDSHYVVESSLGNIRIREILFQGELTVAVEEIPIMTIKKYGSLISGEVIATTASFNFETNGKSQELSFNKIEQTGEIHVVAGTPKQ